MEKFAYTIANCINIISVKSSQLKYFLVALGNLQNVLYIVNFFCSLFLFFLQTPIGRIKQNGSKARQAFYGLYCFIISEII